MKWIALAMMAGGVASFYGARWLDESASFKDGSFIAVIALFLLAIALEVAGLGTLGVLAFKSL